MSSKKLRYKAVCAHGIGNGCSNEADAALFCWVIYFGGLSLQRNTLEIGAQSPSLLLSMREKIPGTRSVLVLLSVCNTTR